MTFGERILSIRKRLKWSQDELAKKVGTSAPIIGRHERNEMKPSIETARRLANALNVTLDYLVGDSDSVLFDKNTTKRIEAIDAMGDGDKDALFKIIDAYIRDHRAKKAYVS
ncbi:helix-turn-helix domain-containing protein [Ulvibacterium marinum]|uniref:helix-turn-helix domain-containing protein n=1 Tax=Ulvibacterium marinum TaxID=2419782 RepID=UPI002493EE0F|nr:helix-turn-helix transcriptional regulator [Ulvibacterium marinum]